MNHHAYLYEGTPANFKPLAEAAREMLNLEKAATPDVIERWYDKLGIDESRELTQMASLRGIGKQSLFVLGISFITTEAQQALLKLFEEPREGLTFVVLMPHGVILPTLRSRMMAFPEKLKVEECRISEAILISGVDQSSAKEFLASNPKERSEMLAKILKADDAKDRLRALINEIESMVYTGKQSTRIEALSEIATMRPYLADRSPSLKMIFEHLAVVLPKV